MFPRKNTKSLVWLIPLLLTGALFPLDGQRLPKGPEAAPARVQRQVYLMGTSATLTAEAPDRATGLAHLERLLTALEQTEAQLSTWRNDSLLSRLNRTTPGTSFQLSEPICRLFGDLFYWHERTRGAFDPAIGEMIQAWGLRQGGRLPDSRTLHRALERSGMQHLQFDGSGCRITRRRPITLDAGAFGKGEALDRARRLSRRLGLSPWMIDLGGQLMVEGAPFGADGWQVGLAHPMRRHEAMLQIRLAEGSLAVSGGSERDLQVAGRRIGHILDPRSGQPAGFEGSVAVWHSDALAADILSTALYVMGVSEGMAWAEENGFAVCFLTASPARMECTTSFRRLLLAK